MLGDQNNETRLVSNRLGYYCLMLGHYNIRLVARQPSLVSQVDPELNETWDNLWFLTFDVDWAADEVIADTWSRPFVWWFFAGRT